MRLVLIGFCVRAMAMNDAMRKTGPTARAAMTVDRVTRGHDRSPAAGEAA